VYGALDTSTSALVAQRTNLNVIAGNIAMKDSVTFDRDGKAVPYRRHVVLFEQGDPSGPGGRPGTHVAKITEDTTPFGLRWAPGHPHAITEGVNKGYVLLSNVDYHTEMVNAITAARAYEANVTVIETTKAMAQTTLRLIA